MEESLFMKTWFTSDPHFGHANVITYCNRPYADVSEMNERLVKNWNDVVGLDDTVYCLGDFSLGFTAVEAYARRLNGHKLLVPGNHDWCHPAHKKSRGDKLQGQLDNYKRYGFNVLPIQSCISLPEIGEVNLCHLPYFGDTTDDRYPKYRLPDDGKVLICGHVHEKWKTKFTPLGTLMVNVGVDVWDQKPISLDTLKATILSELKNKSSS